MAVPFARYRRVLVPHHLLPTVSDERVFGGASGGVYYDLYLPIFRPLSYDHYLVVCGCVCSCVCVCACGCVRVRCSHHPCVRQPPQPSRSSHIRGSGGRSKITPNLYIIHFISSSYIIPASSYIIPLSTTNRHNIIMIYYIAAQHLIIGCNDDDAATGGKTVAGRFSSPGRG